MKNFLILSVCLLFSACYLPGDADLESNFPAEGHYVRFNPQENGPQDTRVFVATETEKQSVTKFCQAENGMRYPVRIQYPATRSKGIERPEFADLSACDENDDFIKVRKYSNLKENFFDGANKRSCLATLAGCR